MVGRYHEFSVAADGTIQTQADRQFFHRQACGKTSLDTRRAARIGVAYYVAKVSTKARH